MVTDTTASEPKKGGPVSRTGFYSLVSQYTEEAITKIVEIMRTSRNESLVLGAANAILDKTIPDLKAIEMGGALDENGERQPLRLLINAGNGFLPATVTVSTPPTRSPAEPSTEIQSVSLAPEGAKDIHSDNGNSQTSTP